MVSFLRVLSFAGYILVQSFRQLGQVFFGTLGVAEEPLVRSRFRELGYFISNQDGDILHICALGLPRRATIVKGCP